MHQHGDRRSRDAGNPVALVSAVRHCNATETLRAPADPRVSSMKIHVILLLSIACVAGAGRKRRQTADAASRTADTLRSVPLEVSRGCCSLAVRYASGSGGSLRALLRR